MVGPWSARAETAVVHLLEAKEILRGKLRCVTVVEVHAMGSIIDPLAARLNELAALDVGESPVEQLPVARRFHAVLARS
jgi:hypothetical protein